MPSRRRHWETVLRILCAAVFLSLGLAHHAPAMSPVVQGEEYQLPDGSFADLCSEHSHRPTHTVPTYCEFCLLGASLLLPPPDIDNWLPADGASVSNPLRQEAAVFGFLSIPHPRSRAPPAFDLA